MIKKLMKISGAQVLGKQEQQMVTGGIYACFKDLSCPPGYICRNFSYCIIDPNIPQN
jgi:hypothetical protein